MLGAVSPNNQHGNNGAEITSAQKHTPKINWAKYTDV